MKGINRIKLSVNQYLRSIAIRKDKACTVVYKNACWLENQVALRLLEKTITDSIETIVLNTELTQIRKYLKKLEKKSKKYAVKIDKYGDKIEKLQANI